MTYFHAIILGIVEGITEFLPISSTAHLSIASDFLGLPQNTFLKTFEVAIQSGAIIAVMILYIRKILGSRTVFWNVARAFIPTVIIGLLAYSVVKKMQGNLFIIGLTLFLGGIAFIVIEKILKKREVAGENSLQNREVGARDALWLGIIQTLAFIPGISRSGATIFGGLLRGISRKNIVEFSFLLSIPTMLSATGLDLIKTGTDFTGHEWRLLFVGILVSCITALIAIRTFLRYIEKNNFIGFGWYRIILGIVVLVVAL